MDNDPLIHMLDTGCLVGYSPIVIFSESLFEKVLLDPVVRGSDKLVIVTGYASPGMVGRHLKEIEERHLGPIDIELIIGMTAAEGLSKWAHQGFVALSERASGRGNFRCSYVVGRSEERRVGKECPV